MNQNKLNISTLADKLVNGKWLINATAHTNFINLIHTYISNPTAAIYVEENEYTSNIDAPIPTGEVTAIINVNGILVKGCSGIEEQLFGLVDTDYIRYCLEDAVNDTNVKDIVLNFNSPGGETTGIEELGRKIKEVNLIKPVYAWTETMMCSAAYWLGSQASRVGMSPSSIVGSIGVYSLIQDCSKSLEQEGVNIQAISAGKYKLMGANFKPLTDEEKQILQEDVDKQHIKFKDAVLGSRQVPIEYMEGLSYEGQQALAGSLVDVVVDDMEMFLNINMKNYKKVSIAGSQVNVANSQAAVVNSQAAVVNSQAAVVNSQAALPGVPTNEVEPEPTKKEYDNGYTECPHCGKKLSDPVEEPDGDETLVVAAAVAPQAVAVAPQAVAVAPQAVAVAPEVKVALSQSEQWNALFGRKTATNAFYNAAIKHVLENK